jgi:Flp pilus assembly protein protease CpaA
VDTLSELIQLIPTLLSNQFAVLLCILFLTCASWLDKRTGFVPNRFWLISFILGGLVCSYETVALKSIETLGSVVTCLPITLLLSLVLFYMKVFGGSDSKALVSVSIFIPTLTPLFNPSMLPIPTSVPTVANFIIILIPLFSFNVVRNSLIYLHHVEGLLVSKIPLSRKLLLICLYKKHAVNVCPTRLFGAPSISVATDCPYNTANNKHSSKQEASRVFLQDIPSDIDVVEIWAPLRIPLIPFLTCSLVVSLTLGDLLLIAVA